MPICSSSSAQLMTAAEVEAALTLSFTGPHWLRALNRLYRLAGSFSAIVQHHDRLAELAPDCPGRLAQVLADISKLQQRSQDEMQYARCNGIRILPLGHADYPQRLAQCADAPLVLYSRGQACLNARHVLSIVGTRHATAYADECLQRLVDGLQQQLPDVLIVSGLAYGVDIKAHRQALAHGLPTVGVLAHGLDTLYPARHRTDAERMVSQGALLTEYPSHTVIDKRNFVQRNRIVAGMADATLLVESAAHGGGLITCRLAQDYSREVMAFPGNVGQPYSEGCNQLIRDNTATLVTSVADVLQTMGWEPCRQHSDAQKSASSPLPSHLSPDARLVVDVLRRENNLHIDRIVALTSLPSGTVMAALFQLEMQGLLTALGGSHYHLKL